MALYADLDALRASAADVRIVTSDGQTIAAHSYVLATASPVLERMIDRAWRGGRCTIRVLGVPSDAVLAFLHLLYGASSRAAADPHQQRMGVRGEHCFGWCAAAMPAQLAAAGDTSVFRFSLLTSNASVF
ncbi:unnamed protein product [Urochloa humidicola]